MLTATGISQKDVHLKTEPDYYPGEPLAAMTCGSDISYNPSLQIDYTQSWSSEAELKPDCSRPTLINEPMITDLRITCHESLSAESRSSPTYVTVQNFLELEGNQEKYTIKQEDPCSSVFDFQYQCPTTVRVDAETRITNVEQPICWQDACQSVPVGGPSYFQFKGAPQLEGSQISSLDQCISQSRYNVYSSRDEISGSNLSDFTRPEWYLAERPGCSKQSGSDISWFEEFSQESMWSSSSLPTSSTGVPVEFERPVSPFRRATMASFVSHDVDQGLIARKRFACPVPNCEKRFTRPDELKRHHRIHTGDRPYPCKYCPRAFGRSDHLRTHTRSHTGERPYLCEQCGKRFARSDERTRHRKLRGCGVVFSCAAVSMETQINSLVSDSRLLARRSSAPIIPSVFPEMRTGTCSIRPLSNPDFVSLNTLSPSTYKMFTFPSVHYEIPFTSEACSTSHVQTSPVTTPTGVYPGFSYFSTSKDTGSHPTDP